MGGTRDYRRAEHASSTPQTIETWVMNNRLLLPLAAMFVALATILGAFGAHALQTRLAPERLAIYETAVRYQFYHALGLLVVGWIARSTDLSALRWSGLLIALGIVLFSGSIYALSFGAPRPLGVVTPIGGLALIAGWLLFATAMMKA